jgi:uncharacterized membrane protein
MTIDEAFTYILSAGAVTPEQERIAVQTPSGVPGAAGATHWEVG